jgi:D-arginine dehydrogenase
VVDAPGQLDIRGLPLTVDIGDTFYVKPETTRLLCSPADETPTPPGDAKPAELTIARALDTVNDATVVDARHVRSSWAGLRSFAPDRHPVVGFDDRADGFFWCAGQGGFGIQTAPALARVGAALLRGEGVAADIVANGVAVERIAASRFADR